MMNQTLVLRLLVYGAYPFLMAGAIHWDVINAIPGEDMFTEHSWVEVFQIVSLGLCALICLPIRLSDWDRRPTLVGLGVLCLCMCIREMDYWLDRWLFDGSWQVMVSVILLLVAAWAWPRRSRLIAAARDLTSTREFGFLLSAFFALVFSRFFGMRALWIRIMGENYDRSIKNAVEECTEMLGFFLIAVAAVELLIRHLRGQLQRAD